MVFYICKWRQLEQSVTLREIPSPETDVKTKMSKTCKREGHHLSRSYLACTGSHSRPHAPGVGTPVTGLHSVPVLPVSTVYLLVVVGSLGF